MADVKKYAKWVLKWESGYVNDPLDKGGETNKGITIATWKAAGYDTSVKIPQIVSKSGKVYKNVTKSLYEMTDDQFIQILKKNYWDKWQADKIKSQSVAEMLVQWCWGSGPITGIKNGQKVLGVTVDGIVGIKTLEAVNKANPRELWEKLKQAREKWLRDIVKNNPLQEKFLKGWLNRLNDMKFEY